MGAVRRVAEKLPGVEAVDIDLAAQKVDGDGGWRMVAGGWWLRRRPLTPTPCCIPCTAATPVPATCQVVVKGANLDAVAVKAGVAKSGKATELWS